MDALNDEALILAAEATNMSCETLEWAVRTYLAKAQEIKERDAEPVLTQEEVEELLAALESIEPTQTELARMIQSVLDVPGHRFRAFAIAQELIEKYHLRVH